MKNNYIKLIALALIVKLLYFLFALSISNFTEKASYTANPEGYISSLKKNDAFWYARIAQEGYPKITDKRDLGFHDGAEYRQSEWAFFPLYPFLLGETSKVTGGSLNMAFILNSWLFSLAGFLLFYTFVLRLLNNKRQAFYASALLILFPFHYYFSVFYTEALFFTFLISSFLAIHKRQYVLMGLLLIPLTLVRPNGIVMVIPLYLYMLEKEEVINGYTINVKRLITAPLLLNSSYFLTAVVSFAAYGLFQQLMTGDFFAFSAAQQGWYRELRFPLLSLFREGNLANQFNSIYTVLAVLFAILSWKRFPLSLNFLIWLSLLLPLASGSVQSMPRFISLVFPFMIVMADWLGKMKWAYLVLTALFCLQLYTYFFWLTNHPLSY